MMQFHMEHGRHSAAEAIAQKLLDTAGAERDEAKAVLREIRSSMTWENEQGGMPTGTAGNPPLTQPA